MQPSLPLDVSRETLERLEAFQTLVVKWTKSINLISKSSVQDVWNRHISDSAQLADLSSKAERWVDIGSGGGFPGLVLAILSKEKNLSEEFVLIESDQRKCAFLREATRVLDLNVRVVSKRIEEAPPESGDILSARALSSLGGLLSFADRHLKSDGIALFMKGANFRKEIEEARESWSFDVTAHKSFTDPDAAVLEVKDIQRV